MPNKDREPLSLLWDFHNNWGPMLSRAGDMSALYQKAVVSAVTSWTAPGAHGTPGGAGIGTHGALTTRITAAGSIKNSSSSLSPAAHVSGAVLPMIHVVGVNTLQLTPKGLSTTAALTTGSDHNTEPVSVSASNNHAMSVPHGRQKQRNNSNDGRVSYDVVSSLQKTFRSSVHSLELDGRAGNGGSKDETISLISGVAAGPVATSSRFPTPGYAYSSPTRTHRALHAVHSSSASAAASLHANPAASSVVSDQLPSVKSLLVLASPPVRGAPHHWLVDEDHSPSWNFHHPNGTMQKTSRLPAIRPGSGSNGDCDANNNTSGCHGHNSKNISSSDDRDLEQHLPRQWSLPTLGDAHTATKKTASAENFFQLTTNDDEDFNHQKVGQETPAPGYDIKTWRLPVLSKIQSDVESVEESASDDGSVADGQNNVSDSEKQPPAAARRLEDDLGMIDTSQAGHPSPTSSSHGRMVPPVASVVQQDAASLIDTRGYGKFARKKRSKAKSSKH